MTSTPLEAELAWSSNMPLRDTYPTRSVFLAFCAAVQADCERLGRTPFGSCATVKEIEHG